jgi:hypothetical protein
MGRSGHAARAALACLTLLPAQVAVAQEYCVACNGPDALYRCIIENAQPRGGQSLQMLCVTAMAKQGGHATCSVQRATVFECDGAVKRIPWAALDSGPQRESPSPTMAQPEVKPATPAGEPAAPDAPPRTMVDLAKQANEKAGAQMKTLQENTRKTWDCMLSLFTRC